MDKGVPKTRICLHQTCQPDAEYQYLIVRAMLSKDIKSSHIGHAYPGDRAVRNPVVEYIKVYYNDTMIGKIPCEGTLVY